MGLEEGQKSQFGQHCLTSSELSPAYILEPQKHICKLNIIGLGWFSMLRIPTVEFHLGCSVEEGFWWKIGEWGRIHLVGSLDCNWQRQQVLTDCQRYFNRWHRMHFFRFSGIFWQIGNWCTLTAFLIFRCPLFQSNIPALLYSSRSARQAYRWPLYKLAEYFC